MSIDAAAGGALKNKPYPYACALIKDMAQNHYQWESKRASVEKRETIGGIHEVNCMDMMKAKMDALSLKVEHMFANPITTVAVDYEICGTKGRLAPECNLLTKSNSDQVNYAQGNPFSNTYYHGWRNRPNVSYKNNNLIKALHLKDHHVFNLKYQSNLCRSLLKSQTLRKSWRTSFRPKLSKTKSS